jgi:hypothetical protein
VHAIGGPVRLGAKAKGLSDMRLRIAIGLTAGLVIGLMLASGATADRVYHSQHIRFEPVGGARYKGGFVQNIHANGPQIYAHEIYKLKKAAPNASYQVHLLAYPFDTDCSGPPAEFGFTPLETGRVGNGSADRVIRLGDVPPEIRGATHGVRWEVTRGGTLRYETDCNAVTLD